MTDGCNMQWATRKTESAGKVHSRITLCPATYNSQPLALEPSLWLKSLNCETGWGNGGYHANVYRVCHSFIYWFQIYYGFRYKILINFEVESFLVTHEMFTRTERKTIYKKHTLYNDSPALYRLYTESHTMTSPWRPPNVPKIRYVVHRGSVLS